MKLLSCEFNMDTAFAVANMMDMIIPKMSLLSK